jgi:predicted RNA-binding Zn ribbon-like protein
MKETRPTAATMRFDGGHPALELVNTVYGQDGEPPEADVLARPADLVTFALRLGLASEATPASAEALRAALDLRTALDRSLRAHLRGTAPRAEHRAALAGAGRSALAAGTLAAADGAALTWSWDDRDPLAPVHRLAHAALGLLADRDALTRLRMCDACCWLFIDRSRGAGRRWCSMADCGTEAKKRRYVARRRERRSAQG